MSINLISVLAKLGRAHEHAQSIKNEILAWKNSKPYTVTREKNVDSTRYSLVVHIGIYPPVERWTLMFGDAVHNLRCALDHLVYAIAIRQSGQNPPPDEGSLMFPICGTNTSFSDARKRRLSTLSLAVQTAIENCQPYNRRHKDLPPLLSVLDEIEKADKHRLLRVAVTTTVKGEVNFRGAMHPDTVMNFIENDVELKEGAEIAAYTLSRPEPDMEFGAFNFLFIVAITHAIGPSGKNRTDIPSLLTLLDEEVRDVIGIVSAAAFK
jgi:hypothetical protein